MTIEDIRSEALSMISEIDPFTEDSDVNIQYSYYIKGICEFSDRLSTLLLSEDIQSKKVK